MAYKVILSTEVSQAIDSIHDYITTVLLSPQSAKKYCGQNFRTLKKVLETFPEAGFDADEKIGLKINSKYPTRGKIIGQYILLYFIDQTQRTVFLSHLFHTKSDYITLLQSKNNKNSKSSF